jgi:hypothetical protein
VAGALVFHSAFGDEWRGARRAKFQSRIEHIYHQMARDQRQLKFAARIASEKMLLQLQLQ